MQARWLAAIGVAIGVLLLAWWWLSRTPPSAEPVDRPAETRPSEPAAESQDAPSAVAPAASVSETALAPPGAGEPFTIPGPGGRSLQGRLWRASSTQPPLLLLGPDDRVTARDWQPMVELLRQVRDYHLAAWDGLARTDPEHEGAARLREMVAIEAVRDHIRQVIGDASGNVGLVGLASGGTAALLLSAEQREVMATVAISPDPTLGPQSLSRVTQDLSRRQVMALGGVDDLATAPILERLRSLPHARIVTVPGSARGLDVLLGDRRLMATVNGWLFAALGPVAR